MTQIDPASLLQQTPLSNAAKSARRLFFTSLEQSLAERGHFHVDWMYGAGSSVLLRLGGVFFLLTAKHVLTNNMPKGFPNESPFWVSMHSRPRWDSLLDFMYPRRLWNIGERIRHQIPLVDHEDICLIELFDPLPGSAPDCFIDLDGETHPCLNQDQFFAGQFLTVCGYPFRLNEFAHDDTREGFTHMTTIHKSLVTGVLLIEEKHEMLISFDVSESEVNHDFLNGMSGGPIVNLMPEASDTKLAGIAISAGDNICRFYPFFAIYPAIREYQQCSCQIIDPLSDLTNPDLVGK